MDAKTYAIFKNMSSGRGGANQRLVADLTTTESVTEIIIDKDLNGNPFSLKEAHISFSFPSNPENADNSTQVWVFPDSKAGNTLRYNASMPNKTSDRGAAINVNAIGNLSKVIIGNFAGTAIWGAANEPTPLDDGFTYLNLICRTAGNSFAAGTRIVMWGVDQ